MTTSMAEIKAAVGEYLPSLVRGATEGSDSYAALAAAFDGIKAGSLSWARLNQCMHRCSEAGMSEGCFRYYFLEAPVGHPYPVEKVFSATSYLPPEGLTEITSIQQIHWGLRRFVYDAMLY